MKQSKNQVEPIVSKSDRKFTKPSSISQCLKCPICLQVFFQPTRLFCGHTFCYACIDSCIKSKPNCPICRTDVDVRNVGKDLLAYSIINELEVFCLYEDCSWKGELEWLEMHLQNECLLAGEGGKKRGAEEKENALIKKPLDEEVEEQINNNVNQGCLISRAIMRDNALKTGTRFDLARKMLRTETEPLPKPAKSASLPSKELKTSSMDPDDDFDFLMELYK